MMNTYLLIEEIEHDSFLNLCVTQATSEEGAKFQFMKWLKENSYIKDIEAAFKRGDFKISKIEMI